MTLPDGGTKPDKAGPFTTYFRWRPQRTFFAHLFKAVVKQHHREDLPVLRGLIPRDGIVLDVGAHAGQFTKLFSRLADRGFVLAVEPGSYARVILRLAVLLNRRRNVAILPFALGASAGLTVLRLPVKRSGSFGFGLSHLGTTGAAESVVTEVVAVATIDALVESLGITRLDFIKADIEGWERQMIAGAARTLAALKPSLLLELHEGQLARAGNSLTETWAALEALGYRPFIAERDQLTPLAAPRQGDVFWRPGGDT